MKRRTFDVAVAYRIYPQVSRTPAVHPDDKLSLAELCLRSFRASLGDLRVKVWALLDGCPPPFEELFRRCFDPGALEILRLDRVGNRATFVLQTRILLEQQDAERVYFAEDDYFYLPGQFPAMLELLESRADVHFVSPYDHPDYYNLRVHPAPRHIHQVGERRWQAVGSTCLTFLTTRSVLRRTAEVFRSYGAGNHDASLWFALTKCRVRHPWWLVRAPRRDPLGFRIAARAWRHSAREILLGRRWRLWAPVPSIATHLEECYLAPGVEWGEWFDRARGHGRDPMNTGLPSLADTGAP